MSESSQAPWPLSWIGRWHNAFVFQRRVRVLAEMLSAQIPQGARVLDIGCGDGTIGSLIAQRRPDISIHGVEVLPRSGCKIACTPFDGKTLPFAGAAFDLCMFVDVLHHTPDVTILLKEAVRVSRQLILLKDHRDQNICDDVRLRLMDWVGNRPHGVVLPYNYQSEEKWRAHFAACGAQPLFWTNDVPLYLAPFSWLFGGELHFVALLQKDSARNGET
ncbi:MAG TPA: class I SAM-dependent methyltransferase [Candidatus Acidoferrum sp.]|jgi:SAM-dependent methyltransferase